MIAGVILTIVAAVILAFYFKGQSGDHVLSASMLDSVTEKGTQALRENRYDAAMELFTPVLNAYNSKMGEEEMRICARAFNNAGYIQFFHAGNYALAYTYFLNAKDISEKLGLARLKARSYLNIGNIYGLYNLGPQAEENYTKAFFTALENEDWEIVLTSYMNLVSGHLSVSDIKGMEPVIEAFDKASIPADIPNSAYVMTLHGALSSYAKGDLAGAIDQLRAGDSIHPEGLGSDRISLATPILLGMLNLQQGDMPKARVRLQEALRLATDREEMDLTAECWRRLGYYYDRVGQQDSARICNLRHYEIRDKLFNVTEFNAIKEVAQLHGERKFQDNLKAANERRRLIEEILTVVVLFTCVIVALLIWIGRKNRELHERNVELYRKYVERTSREQPEETLQAVQAPERGLEMDEKQVEELYRKICEVLDSEEVFSAGFSADVLATLTDSKTRYISYVLAEKTGKSLSTLITEKRIKEASIRLKDPDNYGQLTIEAISESVGFKSRTYFTTVFKKITGLTPREFQNIALSEREKEKE